MARTPFDPREKGCPFHDVVSPKPQPGDSGLLSQRIADVEREVGEVAQAVRDMTRTWTDAQRSSEDKFTAIFSKLDQNNVDAIHRTEALGNTLATDIKNVNASRMSSVTPQILALISMGGLFAGAVYMYMSGQSATLNQQLSAQSTLFSQQLATQSAAISHIEVVAVKDLRDVNNRLFDSQEAKGHADERTTQLEKAFVKFVSDYESGHKALDDKLQREITKEREIVKAEVVGVDARLQAEIRAEVHAIDGRLDEMRLKQISSQEWSLKHAEETAYFRGKTDAAAAMQAEQQKIMEERQYINTGSINSLSARAALNELRMNMFSDRQHELVGSRAKDSVSPPSIPHQPPPQP
jgi:hypothetical protein